MKKRYSVALWAIAIIGYYILFQLFYNMVAYRAVYPYKSPESCVRQVIMNFIPITAVFILNILTVFYGFKSRHTSLKIAIDFTISCILASLVNIFYTTILGAGSKVDWAGTAFNNIIIFLGVETVYYVVNFRNQFRKKEEQKQLALKYRYDALKASVNPHFLFNSLNILYCLIDTDREKSQEFILSLTNIYRYIMANQGKDMVPLRDEIQFMRDYVSVLEKRYHNQFEVSYEGDRTPIGCYLVPYTLQLLIENVAKHNVISCRNPMKVKIIFQPDEIIISNPIAKKEVNSPSEIGLSYLSELYERHGCRFHVENDGKIFSAHVPYIYKNIK